MRLRLWMAPVALLVLGGAIGGASITTTAAVASNQTEIPAVEAALTQAVLAKVTAGDIPAAYTPDGKPLPAQVLRATEATAQQELQDSYTGQALTELEPPIQNNVAQQESNGLVVGLGGGVDWTHFDQVGFTGTTAHVNAHVQVWHTLAQVPGPGDIRPYTSHAVVVIDATMVLQNGRWLISNERTNYAPGSGP